MEHTAKMQEHDCSMFYVPCFVNLLGVRIDNFSHHEILEKIESFLNEPKFHQIATVNPEFILEAQKDGEFKNILNGADLNVADGIGIWYAFLRFGKILKARISGVDLMHEILHMANEKKLSVFLAVNKNGLSKYEEIRNAFKKIYPNLKINGANIDISSRHPIAVKYPGFTDYRSPAISFDVLLCNFGAPYQEKFIQSVKDDTIHLAMGVGGSFDYVTRKIKRAPKIMRIFGLEWLWRLILQPQRWKRIWNAVFVFPIKIILSKQFNE